MKTHKTSTPKRSSGCLPFLLLTLTVCILIAMGKGGFQKNLDYFLRGEADLPQFFSDVSLSYRNNLTYPDFIFPLNGTITSPFGERINPLNGQQELHTGIDLDINAGTEVRASSDGTVIKTATDERFGNYIILQHNDVFSTCYAHLEKWLVQEGAIIKQGDTIGIAGESGNATGKHLHFEIRKKEQRMNPLAFLPKNEAR